MEQWVDSGTEVSGLSVPLPCFTHTQLSVDEYPIPGVPRQYPARVGCVYEGVFRTEGSPRGSLQCYNHGTRAVLDLAWLEVGAVRCNLRLE